MRKYEIRSIYREGWLVGTHVSEETSLRKAERRRAAELRSNGLHPDDVLIIRWDGEVVAPRTRAKT